MSSADRAIVVGGSIAGLLAARVLLAHFSEVVLVERDHFPEQADFRKGVPQFGISILDRAVWDQVESVLTRPEVIAAEIERLRVEEPSAEELIGVDRRLVEVGRRQRALVDQLALVDPGTAMLVGEQLAELSSRRRALESEREAILGRREAWETANARYDRLEGWCGQVAARLGGLSYREKRLALEALNLVVRVWKRNHTPRYEITATIPMDDFIAPVNHTVPGTVCSSRRCAGRRGRFR